MTIKNLLFYRDMLNQALEDGVISDDEHALLNNIQKNYKVYEEHLKFAMKDGVITDEETNELREKRKNIYKKALETALKDGSITDAELKLLKTLSGSIGLSDYTLEEIEEGLRK